MWRAVLLASLMSASPRRWYSVTGWPAAAAALRPEVRAVRKRPRRRWRMTRKAEEAMMEPVRVVSGRRAMNAPDPSWEQEMRRVVSRWGTTAAALVASKVVAERWSWSHAVSLTTAASARCE